MTDSHQDSVDTPPEPDRDGTSGSGTNQSGEWIGCVRGLRLRDPGPDADGPILEIHGEDGLAAMEFDDEAFVDGLTHTAAELKTALEACEVHTETNQEADP
jgi:hypothetical protein